MLCMLGSGDPEARADIGNEVGSDLPSVFVLDVPAIELPKPILPGPNVSTPVSPAGVVPSLPVTLQLNIGLPVSAPDLVCIMVPVGVVTVIVSLFCASIR